MNLGGIKVQHIHLLLVRTQWVAPGAAASPKQQIPVPSVIWLIFCLPLLAHYEVLMAEVDCREAIMSHWL